MSKQKRKKGFTLVEIIVVTVVVAVILTMVIGVGKHVKDQAKIETAQSTLIVLTSALEQYYADEDKMPFETIDSTTLQPVALDESFDINDFQQRLAGTISFATTNTHTGTSYDNDWSGEALYYFLNKSPNSRSILKTLNESYVSSLNAAGVPLTVTISFSSGATEQIIMPRVIDPWGNAYRYRYEDGNTCCRITSAGPDGNFETPGDNLTI